MFSASNFLGVVVCLSALTACAPPAVPVAAAAPLVSSAIPPYDRSAFGDGWASTGHGCDTRDAVLRRDVRDVTNADRCGPLAGTLRDPYSGVIVVGPTRQLDVDHVAALEWLWVHGAWSWPQSKREAVANDPLNLQTTTARENRSKGSRGVESWRPKQDPCGYSRRFDAVADKYGVPDDGRDGVVAAVCR